MPSLVHKRGTRALIDAAATANALRVGEVYLITDENRLTVGTASNAHQPLAKQNEGSAGGADASDPNAACIISDDFVAQSLETGEIGAFGWSFANGSVLANASEQNHPGIILRRSGTTANLVATFYLGAGAATTAMRFDECDAVTWIFRCTAANTDTVYQLGLLSALGNVAPASGIYLERLAADANWFFVTRSAATQTRTNSGLAFNTNWVKIRIRRINASSVGFAINNGAEIVVTTNVPLAATGLMPGMQISPAAAIARDVLLDFFAMKLLPVSR
jgi:hypothetical protein